jgi:diaminopimelate decarboxylase
MLDFQALCNRVNSLSHELSRQGLPVGDINVGGGLGVDYEHPDNAPLADFDAYFDVFRRHLDTRPGQLVHFELGRSIVAPCGSLITRVLYVKEGTSKRFAIVDGSMTELIRPALYHAFHLPQNISSDAARPVTTYDVVGPVCESSDVFAKAIDLPECHRGDFIAFRTAGAYGETMASGYNARPLPKSYFSTDFL